MPIWIFNRKSKAVPLKPPKNPPKNFLAGAQKQKAFLLAEAKAQGFAAAGIAAADAPYFRLAGARLRQALAEKRLADMEFMYEKTEWRADPRALWPEARSLLMLGLNYGPEADPRAVLRQKSRAAISVYARNRDYHELIKGRLKHIAGRFAARTGEAVKVFVDTAPVMEKPLAQAAGLGFQGKHTNLVSRQCGSWLFLGAIFTTAALPPDKQEDNHCGSCAACLAACPTQAFPAPFKLDANKCISYLTIERKTQIPLALRPLIGNRIYGCDDCLAACPWNKFAQTTREAKLAARHDLLAPPLRQFLAMNEAEFRNFFSGSPIKRIGHARFLRNVLLAAGNSGNKGLIPAVQAHLTAESKLVRGMSIWSLGRLMPKRAFLQLRAARQSAESDAETAQEWAQALPPPLAQRRQTGLTKESQSRNG